MRKPLNLATYSLATMLIVAGCSSTSTPKSTGTTTSGPATSPNATSTSAALKPITPDAAAKLYQAPGPYPVGVLSATLPKGNKVEVWYPAVKGSAGKETYDVRDFVSPALKALLTANVPATITYDATRNAAAAAGKFPIVLFSHGYSGMRLQSTAITAHLASWGMIVASADHPSRDLFHLLDAVKPAQSAVDDLNAELDFLTTQGSKEGSVLIDHVDTEHVAAVGHSAGGGTIVGAANANPAIDGYVSLASGLFGGSAAAANDPECVRPKTTVKPGAPSTTAPVAPATPKQPSLFIGGANDHIAVAKCVTIPAFNVATAPTRLWLIDKVGHNGFDDFCRVGNNAGIIGVAIASGLGDAFKTEPFASSKRLGEDGCKPPNAPVTDAYPIINHAITAWLRNLFGVDAKPLGLDASVAKSFSLSVQIEERLG